MRVKNREIVALKKRLKSLGIRGLALDIDETLSFTIGYMIEELIKKKGNPENLTAVEIAKKYKHTDKIPYWQDKESKQILDNIIKTNETQKGFSLTENSNLVVNKVNKIIPISAYITVRPKTIFEGTKFWLKKHDFPKASIITKPKSILRQDGNKWKAKVLEYLYPEIQGIVDDNPGLIDCLGKKYKGIVFLYNNETKRKDIKTVECQNWEDVLKKIKVHFNKLSAGSVDTLKSAGRFKSSR